MSKTRDAIHRRIGAGETISASLTKQLVMEDLAKAAGISYDSLRRYRVRGVVPEPDGYVGRTPWWSQPTVNRWLKTRRVRGGGTR